MDLIWDNHPNYPNEITAIHTGFLGWGGPNVRGFVFEGRDKIFSIGRSPEIYGNFQINCIKIIKNMNDYGENFRKLQVFNEIFLF